MKVKRVKLFGKIKWVSRSRRRFFIDKNNGTINYERARREWRLRKRKRKPTFSVKISDVTTTRWEVKPCLYKCIFIYNWHHHQNPCFVDHLSSGFPKIHYPRKPEIIWWPEHGHKHLTLRKATQRFHYENDSRNNDNDDINHNKTFHRKGTATSSFHKAKKVN